MGPLMHLPVHGVKGVRDINLGMTRKQVHEVAGLEYRTNRAGGLLDGPFEYYPNQDLFVYYSVGGVVTAIEIGDKCEVSTSNEVGCLGKELYEYLISCNYPNVEFIPDSSLVVCLGVNLILSAPRGCDGKRFINSVIICTQGVIASTLNSGFVSRQMDGCIGDINLGREALVYWLAIDPVSISLLVHVSTNDGVQTFNFRGVVYDVFRANAQSVKRMQKSKERKSAVVKLSSQLWFICEQGLADESIETDAYYHVELRGDQHRIVTGLYLLNFYLRCEYRSADVQSYVRIPAEFYDVCYAGVKKYTVYTTSPEEAIAMRIVDLYECGLTNELCISASRSFRSGVFESMES